MKGYFLNQAFNDLRFPANREAMKADTAEYLGRYPLSKDEVQLVLNGDWSGVIDAGASVYTLTKVGATLDVSLLAMGAQMRGQTVDEFIAFLDEQNKQSAPLALLPVPREAR